jgi:hypothetical protein
MAIGILLAQFGLVVFGVLDKFQVILYTLFTFLSYEI